ncbi:MAG: cytidylate kinase-like family protein [Rikenellaceae bacterium]|nr:cytidylate kinase-like family protein [Rikenellaceae bacterium]
MKKKIVITLGRQYGSGGREVGRKLSEMLDLGFYDRKLIDEAARSSGLETEYFDLQDEKAPTGLMHALSVGFGFTPGFSQEALFKIQSDTIKEIASRESCIIVGRCADYVLRETAGCTNIFIHAPLGERARRVARRNGMTEKEALERIARIDKRRAAYYDFYTDKTWGDSKSYHLSIDSSIHSIEKTAAFIKDFVLER